MAHPIPPSSADLERRRLESTIDQDLHSLSLNSLLTTTNSNSQTHSQSFISTSSSSSASSVEYPRAFGEGNTNRSPTFLHPTQHHGPHGTPRAGRKVSGMSVISVGESPVSTEGHHVSNVTLADRVFRRGGYGDGDSDSGSEWDPERSLGRLVGELGRVMSDRISPRPTSPFSVMSPPRSPRSPSPLNSQNLASNLSFTLGRNDPLLSPPSSGSGDTIRKVSEGAFTSISQRLNNETEETNKANSQPAIRQRRALGHTTIHNIATPAPKRATSTPKQREKDNAEVWDEERVSTKEHQRVKAIQRDGNRRTTSPPARMANTSADLTGMTGLLATPAKGWGFGSLGKNAEVGGEGGGNIPATLATLHARLRALETENSLSRRRVRELEVELEKASGEVELAKRDGQGRLREVIGEKTALEDLVKSLRAHLARLTIELEQNKALVSELRQEQSGPPLPNSPPRPNGSVRNDITTLRRDIDRLDKEVERLNGIVEAGLETRRKGRSERTVRMEEGDAGDLIDILGEGEDLERVRKDVAKRQQQQQSQQGPSKLRQGLHQSAAMKPTLMPPTVQPPTRVQPRVSRPTPPPSDEDVGVASPTPTSRSRRSNPSIRIEGPSSPFPSMRDEDEDEFFNSMDGEAGGQEGVEDPPWAKKFVLRKEGEKVKSKVRSKSTRPTRGSPLGEVDDGEVPPQTVLARVIAELEADFAHYKSIYSELADQYKVLDAASAVAKRRVLAEHLREVIDTLEQKADQISALYDLISVRDRAVRVGEVGSGRGVKKSVGDVMRMVRESLGEEGVRRLEEDGVGGLRRRRSGGVV